MPRYVKDGRIIFASNKAYEILYKGQGYLPYEEEKAPQEAGEQAGEEENEKEPQRGDTGAGTDPNGDKDDYSSESMMPAELEGIDPNDPMLAAKVGLLSYDDLKDAAKALGIPKPANTKREKLVELVIEALEAKNA